MKELLTEEQRQRLYWHTLTGSRIDDLANYLPGCRILSAEVQKDRKPYGIEIIIEKAGKYTIVNFEADTENFVSYADLIESHIIPRLHETLKHEKIDIAAKDAAPLFVSAAAIPPAYFLKGRKRAANPARISCPAK